jgi:hypothetical protein
MVFLVIIVDMPPGSTSRGLRRAKTSYEAVDWGLF